jgi:hypothetical protein
MALRHPSGSGAQAGVRSDTRQRRPAGSGKPTIGRADVLAIGEMTVMRQDLGANARHFRTKPDAR